MNKSAVDITKGTTYVFPDSACMAAVDVNNAIIMVEQFRIPSARKTIELPGGALRDGESALQSAQREFIEETGLTTRSCRLLFTLDLDLSTTIHRTHVFISSVITSSAPTKHEFRILQVSRAAAIDMVRSGGITHAPTVAAILAIHAKY